MCQKSNTSPFQQNLVRRSAFLFFSDKTFSGKRLLFACTVSAGLQADSAHTQAGSSTRNRPRLNPLPRMPCDGQQRPSWRWQRRTPPAAATSASPPSRSVATKPARAAARRAGVAGRRPPRKRAVGRAPFRNLSAATPSESSHGSHWQAFAAGAVFLPPQPMPPASHRDQCRLPPTTAGAAFLSSQPASHYSGAA